MRGSSYFIHGDIEAAYQTGCLVQSYYTDAGPTRANADPIATNYSLRGLSRDIRSSGEPEIFVAVETGRLAIGLNSTLVFTLLPTVDTEAAERVG